MTDPPPQAISFGQVFEDELAYLRGRWRSVYGEEAPRNAAGASPHRGLTSDHGLVGLALSGGGLGSSTFQLGVVEELDRTGVFDHVDYLSTVSSGGFIGSTISTAMRGGGEFPLREAAGGRESPYLSWLRSNLADTWRGGVVSYVRSFVPLLRGLLANFLLLLPILMVLAVTQAWLFGNLEAEFEERSRRLVNAREAAATAAEEAEWAEKRALGGDKEALALARKAKVDVDHAAAEVAAIRAEVPRLNDFYKPLAAAAGIFLLLVLIFPMLSNVYRVSRQAEEGASSAESRGQAEKAFGILFALVLLVALAPTMISLIYMFHKAGTSGWRGFCAGAAVALALAIFTGAGKLLRKLGGLRQKIALTLVGLLGLVIPLVTMLYVAEDLIYPIAGIEAVAEAGTTTENRKAVAKPTPAYNVYAGKPMQFRDSFRTPFGILAVVMGCGLAAVFAGKLAGSKLRRLLIPVGIPIGALIGYSVLIGSSQALAYLSSGKMGVEGGIRLDVAVLANAALFLVFGWAAIDVNGTSPLALYRDRLASLYLIGVRPGKGAEANQPFVEPDYELSQLCGGDKGVSEAPYHLLNAAVNLHGSRDLLRRQAHGAFVFSKHHCGGERTGYCGSEQLESVFPQMNFQTAMAISASGMSPNASRLKSRVMVALMTLLNVRLGYWVPNPARLSDRRLRRSAEIPLYERFIGWRVSIIELLREILGAVDERHRFVNLSDGGNVDDTGAYELLRRRCKYVIVVDGAPDPDHTFGSLILLRRRAQLDLGVDIELSLEGLRLDRDRQTRRHAAAGRILYPPAEEGGEPETGLLLYIRPTLTGDEDDLIAERRAHSSEFPHESKAAEGLDDRQFSAYHALGIHSLSGLFETPPGDQAAELDFSQFKDWFQGLDERLTPKGIFISYRRADASGHALLIHQTLEKRFPNAKVFLDVGGIEPGEEFTSAIAGTLDRARITLVLIGNQWLGLKGADGTRRLDDPDDTVRSEISMSLAKGKRVIPLLVEQTPMPREEDLPDELRPLAYQNAVNLTHDRFDSDLETLIRILETFLD